MSRWPDVAIQLARALQRSEPGISVVRHESTPWASVTFAGARHRLTIEARATPEFEGWLAALSEKEFALRGHLVADLAVRSIERRDGLATAEIEALTVED